MRRWRESRWVRYGAVAAVGWVGLVLEGVVALGPLRGLELAPLLLLFFALELEFGPGLALTAGLGLAADGLSGLVPGTCIAAWVVWFLILRLAVSRPVDSPPLFVIVASTASAAGCLVLQTRVAAWLGGPVIADAASAVLGAAVLGWPVHAGLVRLDRRFKPRDPMALRPM
ncbi:MAG TPA: hypothetical protein RMG48_02635 [Myxococcales bacterium LLY-WYZ-16_1]|nr:hypothetical protein [Myxococcales bacterium LLY-WYZ-16_1]